jgi:SAM-dependent methyltransferase
MKAAPTDTFSYSRGFFDFIESGARRSATRLLPFVHERFTPQSVLDVGCGRGLWLQVWQQLGTGDILGLDGAYLDVDRLAIPTGAFRCFDISRSFNLGRRWDLVQCLEVAEHIPPDRSETLIDNLTKHSDLILFSAAEPGQGGHYHVNERPLEFWRELFKRRGYQAYDLVRPSIHRDPDIEPWYRYNTLLYVSDQRVPSLPASVGGTRLDPVAPVPRFETWGWGLRRRLLQPLPVRWVTALAVLKNRLRRHS